MTNYAAFYVPSKPAVIEEDVAWHRKITNWFTGAMDNVVKSFTLTEEELAQEKTRLGAFQKRLDNLKELALKMDRVNATRQTQEYAAAALTYIINEEPLNAPILLDALFNTYAPALNATLGQTGYNSIVEMVNAVRSGTINVPNFIQGLSDGLSIVYRDAERIDDSKYGEEIPIDVVTECTFEYTTSIATHMNANNTTSTKTPQFPNDYAKGIKFVKITLKGNIKNERAEMWNISDISNRIVDLMLEPTPITLRVGKTIYENCILHSYLPKITNIYELSFEATLIQEYKKETSSVCQDKIRRFISPDYDLRNFATQEVYAGVQTGVKKEKTKLL